MLLKMPDNAPVAVPFVLDSQLFIGLGSNICIVSYLYAVKAFLVAVYTFLLGSLFLLQDYYSMVNKT